MLWALGRVKFLAGGAGIVGRFSRSDIVAMAGNLSSIVSGERASPACIVGRFKTCPYVVRASLRCAKGAARASFCRCCTLLIRLSGMLWEMRSYRVKITLFELESGEIR